MISKEFYVVYWTSLSKIQRFSFQNACWVFEISPQKPHIQMLKLTWKHSKFSRLSIGILSFPLICVSVDELKELNCFQRAPAVHQTQPKPNEKPFPLDWEIWVEGTRSDLTTEPKLKVLLTGSTSNSLFLWRPKRRDGRRSPWMSLPLTLEGSKATLRSNFRFSSDNLK